MESIDNLFYVNLVLFILLLHSIQSNLGYELFFIFQRGFWIYVYSAGFTLIPMVHKAQLDPLQRGRKDFTSHTYVITSLTTVCGRRNSPS